VTLDLATVVFIEIDEVIEMHAAQLAEHGGSDPTLRDRGAIESALAQALNTAHYNAEADLFDIAAAYAFHIAESQAFADGNKRTGLDTALTFLGLNGIEFADAFFTHLEWCMKAHDGRRALAKPKLATLFRGLHALSQLVEISSEHPDVFSLKDIAVILADIQTRQRQQT
jgi:death on curing protein